MVIEGEFHFFVKPIEARETQDKANDNNLVKNSSDGKADRVALSVFNFTSGAVKKVWAVGSHTPSGKFKPEGQSVYYTPVTSFLGAKRKELEEEVVVMQNIKKRVKESGGDISNLAVEVEVMEGLGKIKGRYTLKVERASCDFEKKMQSEDITMNDRIKFGGHYLRALRFLHMAGFAYGDMKPENCLIYGEPGNEILKLADFGKTKDVSTDESLPYKGNTRFASPEGELSQKGDVYSAALVLIRNFEEEIFKMEKTSDSLLSVDLSNFDNKAVAELRGIEQFVVEHDAFLASNPGLSMSGLKKRSKMGKLDFVQMKEQEVAVHQYIDVLGSRLKKTEMGEKAEPLCNLLKAMTRLDTENWPRISSDDAQREYERIFEI